MTITYTGGGDPVYLRLDWRESQRLLDGAVRAVVECLAGRFRIKVRVVSGQSEASSIVLSASDFDLLVAGDPVRQERHRRGRVSGVLEITADRL